ncbi:hypothetical protein HJ158_24040 [Vibrio parahaemolyticus]|nr:hypothetical protein [Vibrio parahaemolyticus]
MNTDTVIVSTFSSFWDVCRNDLISGKNVHCSFYVSAKDYIAMNDFFKRKKGKKLSTSFPSLFQINGIDV